MASVQPTIAVTWLGMPYFHGSPTELQVGKLLLPTHETAEKMTTPDHPARQTREDRVYFTEDRTVDEVINTRAQLGWGRWIYRVLPQGDIEADPEPGGGLMAPTALVAELVHAPLH